MKPAARCCLVLLLLIMSGCGLKEREMAVQKREAALVLREQDFLMREQRLTVREKALREKESLLDSLRQDSLRQDSVMLINPVVLGRWNVTMTCTETNCSGSAVGDTKRETWEIATQDNLVVARAMANNKLVRVYTGKFRHNTLELTTTVEPVGQAPTTNMLVRLAIKDNRTLDGTREIIRGTECRTMFSLLLNKDTKQL